MRIPLFPLQTVVFPEGLLPLRIFEARYLDMVSRCLREDGGFGICQIRSGSEVGAAAEIYDVGTYVRIVEWSQSQDGLLAITVKGEKKFRVLSSTVESDQLRTAEVEWLPEEQEAALPEEFRTLAELLERIVSQLGEAYPGPAPRFDLAGFVGARLTEILPLKAALKQELLEQDDPLVRLFALRDALHNLDLA
jgi:uncharacterized protein